MSKKYTRAEEVIRQHPDVKGLLSQQPACAAMLAEPSTRIWVPYSGLVAKSDDKIQTVSPNELFAVTLTRPNAFKHFVIFWEEEKPRLYPQSRITTTVDEDEDDQADADNDAQGSPLPAPPRLKELNAFVSMGTALCGWPGVVHGGIVTTVFDQLTGFLPMMNRIRGSPIFGNDYMTVYLTTKFRQPVRAPGVSLFTARIARVEGRKCFVEGEVRTTGADGRAFDGPVLASCEGLFVALAPGRPKL